jgi:hypothetical protein
MFTLRQIGLILLILFLVSSQVLSAPPGPEPDKPDVPTSELDDTGSTLPGMEPDKPGVPLNELPEPDGSDVPLVPDVQDSDSDGIGTVTITKSGFMSKNVLEIKYRESDRQILEVIDNGKQVRKNKFYKYQSKLSSALEIDRIPQIIPDYEDLLKRLESPRLPDSVKLEQLRSSLQSIGEMESELAKTYQQILQSQEHHIKLNLLQEQIRQELEANGYTPKKDVQEILLRLDECQIDGEKLSEDLRKKIQQIYEFYKQKKIGENVTISIKFDD